MKWWWLAAMVVVCTAPVFAFEGKVLLEDGTPVADATISILGHPGSTRTGKNGLFSRNPDPPLPFEILVVMPGGQYMAPVLVEELPTSGPLIVTVSPLVAETITVTGGAAPHIEAPPASGMSIVPKEDIARRHPVRLTDVLENVPGTGQVSDLHAAVPAIRGLARGRTLVLIDGARVSSERRAGPSATYLDPFFLEGAEVSRGPGSVAYGSDAFGGVIDARTRRPEFGAPLRVRLKGSLGAGIPERSVGGEIAKGFAEGGMLFQVRYRNFDDYRSPEGTVRNSGASDGGFLARASHELGGGLFSVGWQTDMGWNIGRPMNTPNVIRVSHPEEDSHRLTLSYDMDPLGGFTRIGFNGFLGSYRLVTERDERLPLSRSRRVRQADVSAKDFSFRALAVRPLGQSRLELGFDVNGRFDLEALDSEIVFDAGEGLVSESEQRAIDDASRTDTAVYANAEILLGGRVSGGGGIRFDHVTTANRGGFFGDRSTRHDSVSGYGSLRVELASRLHLTGQISRGFRDPFLSDRYFKGVSGRGLVLGNPALQPEASLQFDLALRYGRESFRWAVFAYRYHIEDLVERFEVGEGLFFFRNRGEARLQGLELEAQLDLPSRMTLEIGAQIESGVSLDDDEPLDDIPAERITGQLRKQLGEQSYGLLRIAWFAPDGDPGPTERATPGYLVIDLGGGWRLSSWASLRLWVRNLLDRAYPISADRRAVLAPGVSAVLTFQAQF
jgi:iron complex outermembrane receptor protein